MNQTLLNEIKTYCEANNIEDVDKFTNKMLRNGFNIEKYGEVPGFMQEPEIEPVINPELVIHRPPVMIKENKSEPEPLSEEKVAKVNKYKINTEKPKKDIYDDEDDYQPKKGLYGSNLYGNK